MYRNWIWALVLPASLLYANEGDKIPFPEGYRNWYHDHSTVNLTGHAPEANIGIQHVYANDAALAGLKSGTFADGATFVVDRFKYSENENKSLSQGDRKVIAIMVRNGEKYKETGGWGFEAFKGGDPNQRVVADGGKTCFGCHIPNAANNYLFTKLHK